MYSAGQLNKYWYKHELKPRRECQKAFSMAEVLVSLMIIGFMSAAIMPLMTQTMQSKTGIDRNTLKCIEANSAPWYKNSDGTTSVPDFSADPICYAAVEDIRYNRGKALETADWYADNGTAGQKVMAKKILRTACDQGSGSSCDYFINTCWKSGSASEPYCDDTNNFLDITYYLHQYDNITSGGEYVKEKLKGLIPKNVTNLVNEVNYACINNQSPDYKQNLNNNIACEIIGLTVPWWIQQCNAGNAIACKYCYDNNYNHSCSQIKSVWNSAETGLYKLTANGNPDNTPPVDVNCNMTSLASAAISGCNAGVSGDCLIGHNNAYNQSCNQIKTVWDAAPTGSFKLTYNGANSPKTVFCNMTSLASAAITGCGFDDDTKLTTYVPGDCTYGYNNNYNRTCDEILAAWNERPSGYYYNLTENGAGPPNPGSKKCPVADDGKPDDPNCGVTTLNKSETGLGYNLVVTKGNIADPAILTANNVNLYSEGYPNGASNSPQCWYGIGRQCARTGCGNDTGGGNYDKYLCNFKGAIKACHALNGSNPEQYGDGCDTGLCSTSSKGWRLPTSEEVRTWRISPGSNSNLIDKVYYELKLCDTDDNNRTPYCNITSGCKGSTNNICRPNFLWTTYNNTWGSRHYRFYNNILDGPSSNSSSLSAHSVRCVRSDL